VFDEFFSPLKLPQHRMVVYQHRNLIVPTKVLIP